MSDYDDFVDVVNNYENDADSIKQMFDEFSQSTSDIRDTVGTMNTGLNDIAVAVDESAKGVTTVGESAVSLVTVMNSISQEMETNREISDNLSSEVGRFKNV